jgi:DNA-binding winged helix-turn-helix (wHTH) protein
MDEEVFAFESFRLIPAQRMLSEDGKPVRIGGRALDILAALTERAGETISKEELIARAWPKRSSKPRSCSGNAVGAARISDVWQRAGRRRAALM